MSKPKRKPSRQPVKQPSRLLWLIIGCVLGFLATDYFAHTNHLPDLFQFATNTKADKPQAKSSNKTPKTPQFDFYTMLQKNRPDAAFKAPLETHTKPITHQEGQSHQRYYLQVAAVQQDKDADRLKAQLLLAGFDVHIKPFKKAKTTWHRILVGPYTTKAKATSEQKKLKTAHVESFLTTI